MSHTVTYEYRCLDCKRWSEHRFRFCKFPREVACPHCGGTAVKGLHTAPRCHLKGWDWHGKDLWDPMDPRNDNPLDFRGVEPEPVGKVFT